MNDLLTAVDVAALFKVCVESVRRWVRVGLLPAADVKQGKRVFWRRKTINAVVKNMPRRPIK